MASCPIGIGVSGLPTDRPYKITADGLFIEKLNDPARFLPDIGAESLMIISRWQLI